MLVFLSLIQSLVHLLLARKHIKEIVVGGAGFTKPRCHLRSLTIKRIICARVPQKTHLEISLACRSINMRLLVPKQGVLHKIKCSAAHAEASPEKKDEEDDCDLSYVKYSHGKKVCTDYFVIGIPGDGRCLFRSVAHGACLRAGKPPPTGNHQRELADDLRARDSGGLVSIAEYGQEYGTENPIRVLYHGFGHYDALHFPGEKGSRSKL
ncbi:hypothetical protein QYF36_022599 [Acer negundo]|nr:hypothetical protein QYF36_022599 [Acer negundo]